MHMCIPTRERKPVYIAHSHNSALYSEVVSKAYIFIEIFLAIHSLTLFDTSGHFLLKQTLR